MSSKTATSASSSSTTEPLAPPSPPGGAAGCCRHFGDCGGCRFQDVEYSRQLVRKEAAVRELLAPLGWEKPIAIHPSPQIWHYRNKMEFSFQDVYPVPPAGEDYLRLGLKRRKRWDQVLDLSECRLMSPEIPGLLDGVHRWARREGLAPYNLHRHTGFLRHLVVREGKNTPDRMVLLLTSPGELPSESFAATVRESYPATTILWGVNGGVSDVARSDGVRVLEGPGSISETVLGLRMRVSPFSFLQTNTRGAELLYSRLRQWLEELKARDVLDLYCGSGGIALCIASSVRRVLGVESVASAVEDARANAAANQIENAEFVEGTVENTLPALASRQPQAEVVIVDPPRSGLHPKALTALRDMAPRWIAYVSCNPKAWAEDLRRLADRYELERVELADLFPHTDHVEVLSMLRAR